MRSQQRERERPSDPRAIATAKSELEVKFGRALAATGVYPASPPCGETDPC